MFPELTPDDSNEGYSALQKAWGLKKRDSRDIRAKTALAKLVTEDVGMISDVTCLAAALQDEWRDLEESICIRLSDISRMCDSVEIAKAALGLLSFGNGGGGDIWSNADIIDPKARRYPVSVDPETLVLWLNNLQDFATHAAKRVQAGENANA